MASDPRTGKILQGRYKIAEPLAEGGMGIVYRAERVGIGRPVVVKFLHTVLSDTPGIVDRFEREARATALLNHPNCVALVDYGLEDGAPYLVMEYVDGKTLADLLDFGPLSPRRSVHVARQVLAGLHHAHDRGILHRDLKPANIMIVDTVGFKDHVKILDFGLAKLVGSVVDGKRDVTVQGIAIGTPGYMSPEQAAGLPSDRRADLYCTGALLYHLVTGTKAFEGDDIHSVLRRHREETPALPRKMTPEANISQALEQVISRAMQREPHKRYQNAEEMITALAATPEGRLGSETGSAAALTGGSPSSSDAATRAEQPKSRRGQQAETRRRGLMGLLAGVIIGGGALAAVVMFTPFGEQLVKAGASTKANATTPPEAKRTAKPEPKEEPKGEPAKVADRVADKTDDKTEPAVPVIELPSTPPQTDPVLAKQIDEADEPPAGVDDGSKDDAKNPPAEPIGVPTLPSPAVKSIAEIRALLRKDDRDGALAGLYRLRRNKPAPTGVKAAEIARLIGHIYFDRKWWTDALKEYRFACTKDSRCKSDASLVNNTVKMLAGDSTYWRARRIITDHLGRSALPALRTAAKNGTPDLRRRAQRVLEHTSRRAKR